MILPKEIPAARFAYLTQWLSPDEIKRLPLVELGVFAIVPCYLAAASMAEAPGHALQHEHDLQHLVNRWTHPGAPPLEIRDADIAGAEYAPEVFCAIRVRQWLTMIHPREVIHAPL